MSVDPVMRSMLSANLRDLFLPSDCNSVNEVTNGRIDLVRENVEKAWRQDTTLATYDSSLKQKAYLSKLYRTFINQLDGYPLRGNHQCV